MVSRIRQSRRADKLPVGTIRTIRSRRKKKKKNKNGWERQRRNPNQPPFSEPIIGDRVRTYNGMDASQQRAKEALHSYV